MSHDFDVMVQNFAMFTWGGMLEYPSKPYISQSTDNDLGIFYSFVLLFYLYLWHLYIMWHSINMDFHIMLTSHLLI